MLPFRGWEHRGYNLVIEQIEILLEKGMLLFHCPAKILAYFHKIKSEL